MGCQKFDDHCKIREDKVEEIVGKDPGELVDWGVNIYSSPEV
jgi:hypothetical protein